MITFKKLTKSNLIKESLDIKLEKGLTLNFVETVFLNISWVFVDGKKKYDVYLMKKYEGENFNKHVKNLTCKNKFNVVELKDVEFDKNQIPECKLILPLLGLLFLVKNIKESYEITQALRYTSPEALSNVIHADWKLRKYLNEHRSSLHLRPCVDKIFDDKILVKNNSNEISGFYLCLYCKETKEHETYQIFVNNKKKIK